MPGYNHANWIWDSFIGEYPKLSEEKRIQVEDALLECAFADDLEIAIKALKIIGMLYRSKISSARLFDLTANKLRERVNVLKVDTTASYYYIDAFMDLKIKEAIPLLKTFIDELQDRRSRGLLPDKRNNVKEDYKYNYKDMMWICCLSLAHLLPKEKYKWLEVFWKEFPERKNRIGQYGTGGLDLE